MAKDSIISHGNGGMTFTGRGVEVYRAKVIAMGLRLYARTGMKPNRAYTPTAMLKAATAITGGRFKRGQYLAAAAALDIWAEHEAGRITD